MTRAELAANFATRRFSKHNSDGDGLAFAAKTRPFSTEHTFASSRLISPELCLISPPSYPRGRRKGRVPAGTHGPLCAGSAKGIAQRHTGEAKHTAFPAQWADGLCRALPGAELLLASLTPRNSRTPRRLTRMPPPQELDRSNDGQDHTVLPYAHSLTATEPDDVVHTATGILARRTFSAAHPHEASGSRRAIRPALDLSCRRCRVHRNPARENDDTRSPLKVEPG